MITAAAFWRSTGPMFGDTTMCALSRRRVVFAFDENETRSLETLKAQGALVPPEIGPLISSLAEIPAKKTAEQELQQERGRRLLALSSSALLASFARGLFSERIQAESEGMLPGLGSDSEMSLNYLATLSCPSESEPVALALSISGSGCSCLRLCPTPTAAGFGVKDVPRMMDRRRRTKERVGNGNGFGLTFDQWVAVCCFTPTASDYKGSTGKGSRRNTLAEQLRELFGQQGKTVYPHPEFVEAVMRFPIKWTELEDSATPSYPK